MTKRDRDERHEQIYLRNRLADLREARRALHAKAEIIGLDPDECVDLDRIKEEIAEALLKLDMLK